MRPRRTRTRTSRRHVGLRLADRLTTVVIGLQIAVLLTFWVTPGPMPPRITLFELFWAWTRRPTFYPLAALLIAGPVLTIVAWTQRGLHRPILLASWAIFGYFAYTAHSDRLMLMVRLLWQRL